MQENLGPLRVGRDKHVDNEQRWEGERMAEETFFYDPAQRLPRRA